MPNLSARRLAACVALLTGLVQVASAADILIVDSKSQPESLTVAPGGKLIVGSASTPFIYQVRPGSTTVEKFVDASSEGAGTFFFGMLADAANNTLWACQLTPVPGAMPVKRHTALRGFDLTTGAEKLRWNLPGENSTCNDFSLGPDKALYISDTANSRIYKLPAGATSAELFLEDHALYGIDGITFLDGTLYVTMCSRTISTESRWTLPARGTAGRYLDGSAGEGTGWHARSQWQATCWRWQRQDFRYYGKATMCSRTISTEFRWTLPARRDSRSISGWISR